MNNTKLITLLRIFLSCAAFGWGISAFAIFLPWSVAVKQLVGLGAGQIPNDPMLNYWLRMTAAVFTAIGIFFFMLALKPLKYKIMLPFAGFFLVGEGLVLLVYGLLLHLPPLPYYVDTGFCLFLGVGIILAQKGIRDKHSVG